MQPQPDSAERLRNAFIAIRPDALHLSQDQRAQLQSEVCAFVEHAKAQGQMPEAVIIAIRRIIESAGRPPLPDAIIGEAVRWCLTTYFGDQALREEA